MVLLRGVELEVVGPLHIEVTTVQRDVYVKDRKYVDIPLPHFKVGQRVRVIVEAVE